MVNISFKRSDPDFLAYKNPSKSFKDVCMDLILRMISRILRLLLFQGLPSLWILEKEVQHLVKPFEFALVRKFPLCKPIFHSIRKFLYNLKNSGEISVTLLDHKHVHIKLSNDLDYVSTAFIEPGDHYIGNSIANVAYGLDVSNSVHVINLPISPIANDVINILSGGLQQPFFHFIGSVDHSDWVCDLSGDNCIAREFNDGRCNVLLEDIDLNAEQVKMMDLL
ncbi:hypothetical protein IEQ34_016062 [Dendrobium chrysotoxum]|uniref:Uncharacterized protein n=1 Tax=Dendrobium chrysotoxum TaxID=161865 RepID=A0AAV7GEF8_DENCH|nr:hypothetical protein IEQ34_016062 [Dendrobium chrysotoxum]